MVYVVTLGVGVSVVMDSDFNLLSAVCPGLCLLVCDRPTCFPIKNKMCISIVS
jgi:hypothetical protein